MSDQLPVNRVEIDVAQWQSKEARLSKLFSTSVSINNSLLREKLKYYENISVKYKTTSNTDERFTVRVLENERKWIMKQLYPNLLNQLVRKLFNVLVIENIKVKNFILNEEKNNQALHDKLQKIGFQEVYDKVEFCIKQGNIEFTIPVSHYINEKERLDYDLKFFQNEDGYYHFDGFKATLKNELNPDRITQHYFKNDQMNNFNIEQSYNLLSGRSIQKDSAWKQFDLNDKYSTDCYRLKEFHSGYGYNIEQEIAKLPLKELRNQRETDELLEKLKNGGRPSVTFCKNEAEHKFYIEANPQFKSINIYDANLKKLTLSSALGVKTLKIINGQLKNDVLINNKASKQRDKRLSQ